MRTPELKARFQTLVDEHKKILFKICRSYCRSADEREDLAQEIIVQLWRSFPSFDQRARFSTWMYRVALNVAISFVRREQTRTRHVLSDDERVLEAIDEREAPSADLQRLHALIDELAPLNKALVLLYLDGNSAQDIADVLGITVTNVATKLGRLKQTLARGFAPTTPDPGANDGSR